jgi:ketosteroid isomerase-like protein
MSQRLFLAIAGVLAAAIALRAQPDFVAADLAGLEDAWAAAVQASDVRALDEIIAEDYVGTTATGAVQNKQQYLAAFVSGDRVTSLLTTEDLDVRLYGDAAVITHGGRAEGTFKGTPTGGEFRWTHVLVRRDGRWQAVSNHVTRIATEP